MRTWRLPPNSFIFSSHVTNQVTFRFWAVWKPSPSHLHTTWIHHAASPVLPRVKKRREAPTNFLFCEGDSLLGALALPHDMASWQPAE
ncbi:hypothetical protein BaRGS_00024050 [Batillaria attramentaria]|uniref:Uncharacterized protein n=1 Tax=Batillaria attramentaria TaxID=370345 RepID=A0ABD0KCF3_9CAEN